MAAWEEMAALFPGGVWLTDFEYRTDENDAPDVRCLVATDCISGRTYRMWRDEMGALPPYPIRGDALFVCYAATAELSCHLALGWPMPACILDLHVEFALQLNGRKPYLKGSRTLLAALAHYGLPAIGGE